MDTDLSSPGKLNVFEGLFWRRFFNVAGGSIFYCVSAVLVAYGAAKVLEPVLSETETLTAALPCIGVLCLYEIALMAVLVFIVLRKVVDDAVSIVIIIALYMVASSIALGSVAGRDSRLASYLAAAATALVTLKLLLMRARFAGVRIPFGILSLAGLTAVIAVNYFGPIWMSELMVGDAAEESVRRGQWFLIQTGMLVGAGLVWLEALSRSTASGRATRPFLQSPAMAYMFALILLAASSSHLYAMGYMYELSAFAGDFLPVIAIASLLLLEILSRSGMRFGAAHVATACIPLLAMGYAIWQRSVGTSWGWTYDMVGYPPVFCVLTGLALAAAALRRRWRPLAGVVFLYVLGAVITFGFSPEQAYSLNVRTCGAVLTAALMAYGIETRRQYYCVAAVVLIVAGAAFSDDYLTAAARFGVTEPGAVLGVGGVALVALAMVFGRSFERWLRLSGSTCMAIFTYDLLGPGFGARHVVGTIVTMIVALALLHRTRDRVAAALATGGAAGRIYLAAGIWRHVFLGFAALAAGAMMSFRKRRSG